MGEGTTRRNGDRVSKPRIETTATKRRRQRERAIARRGHLRKQLAQSGAVKVHKADGSTILVKPRSDD